MYHISAMDSKKKPRRLALNLSERGFQTVCITCVFGVLQFFFLLSASFIHLLVRVHTEISVTMTSMKVQQQN